MPLIFYWSQSFSTWGDRIVSSKSLSGEIHVISQPPAHYGDATKQFNHFIIPCKTVSLAVWLNKPYQAWVWFTWVEFNEVLENIYFVRVKKTCRKSLHLNLVDCVSLCTSPQTTLIVLNNATCRWFAKRYSKAESAALPWCLLRVFKVYLSEGTMGLVPGFPKPCPREDRLPSLGSARRAWESAR